MSRRNFINGVKQAWELIKAFELAETFSNPVSLSASDEFKDISLDANENYEELYLCGLRNSDYNILLTDFSFLQFAQIGVRDLRFAFYPNPFVGASLDKVGELHEIKEYLDEGVIDIEEYLLSVSEVRSSHHPPMTRYEYSPDQFVELHHPSSHLHLGHHSNNRWPVKRVMSIKLFTLMILKQYYSPIWLSCTSLTINGQSVDIEQTYSDAKTASPLVAGDLFTEREAAQLHWG